MRAVSIPADSYGTRRRSLPRWSRYFGPISARQSRILANLAYSRSKSPACLRQLDPYCLDASLDVDVKDTKATIMWNHTYISAALQTRTADIARAGHLGVDPKRTEQVLLGDVMTAHGVPGNGPVFHQSMGIPFDQPAEPVQMEREHCETPVKTHENHSGDQSPEHR